MTTWTRMGAYCCLEPTYEGLKGTPPQLAAPYGPGLEPTYEGLKGLASAASVRFIPSRLEPTYEGLKAMRPSTERACMSRFGAYL